MVNPLMRAAAALVVVACAGAWAPCAAQTPPAQAGPVTVVVEVALAANTAPAEALVAINDMRTMMRRQPGYLSDELLQNLNDGNVPRYVHVSRWASMVYWAALFRTPEFNQLNAHGNSHYSIAASAYLPAD